ncbi:MAG: hypothetical protein ACI4PJ_01030 [Acutalibacteraceae bacterium]
MGRIAKISKLFLCTNLIFGTMVIFSVANAMESQVPHIDKKCTGNTGLVQKENWDSKEISGTKDSLSYEEYTYIGSPKITIQCASALISKTEKMQVLSCLEKDFIGSNKLNRVYRLVKVEPSVITCEGINVAKVTCEGINVAKVTGEGINVAKVTGEGINVAKATGEGINVAKVTGEGINVAKATGEFSGLLVIRDGILWIETAGNGNKFGTLVELPPKDTRLLTSPFFVRTVGCASFSRRLDINMPVIITAHDAPCTKVSSRAVNVDYSKKSIGANASDPVRCNCAAVPFCRGAQWCGLTLDN